MKRIGRQLLTGILMIAMMGSILWGMPQTVRAESTEHTVEAGDFLLSRGSEDLVEGTDYEYSPGSEYRSGKLIILTDGITIAMRPDAAPTSDQIKIGVFHEPPTDSFRNVTFRNLKMRSYYDNIVSYVLQLDITLEGNNEIVSVKKTDGSYGNFAIFGYGNIHFNDSPSGALYASGDGLGWGAVKAVSGGYGYNDAKVTVDSGVDVKASGDLLADIADVNEDISIHRNYIKGTSENAKTLKIGNFVHQHGWKYTAGTQGDSNQLQAVCMSVGSCNYKNTPVTLSLQAQDAHYNGQTVAATMDTSAWKAAGLAVPEIVYYLGYSSNRTTPENSGAASEGAAPKQNGFYTARITVGKNVTATKAFTIICDHTNLLEDVDDAHLEEPATCTMPAKYHKTCADCGKWMDETFSYGKALGHDFSNNAKTCRRAGCDATNPDYKESQKPGGSQATIVTPKPGKTDPKQDQDSQVTPTPKDDQTVTKDEKKDNDKTDTSDKDTNSKDTKKEALSPKTGGFDVTALLWVIFIMVSISVVLLSAFLNRTDRDEKQ